MRTRRYGMLLFVNILIILMSFPFSYGATIIYNYDYLNRLIKVIYENGTTIAFTYDSAGNRLSQVVAYETGGPSFSIASHSNGQHLDSPIITLCGTATDAGHWGNGINRVLVNGVRANNDTASGSGIANWCIQLTLNAGANTITIIAYDNSGNPSTIETLTLYYDGQAKIYLPLILR